MQSPFDVPELFVTILQNLDPLDLVHATKVNRSARDLIRDNAVLHQAIGRTPDPECNIWVHILGRCGKDHKIYPGMTINIPHGSGYHFMRGTYPKWSNAKMPTHHLEIVLHFGLQTGHASGKNSILIRLLDVLGIGRGILLCQPPVKKAELWQRYDRFQEAKEKFGKGSFYSVAHQITSDTGITIGDLSDAAQHLQDARARQTIDLSPDGRKGGTNASPQDKPPCFKVRFELELKNGEPMAAAWNAEVQENSKESLYAEYVADMCNDGEAEEDILSFDERRLDASRKAVPRP
ncbi:hypothetical protein LTR09_000801 [Extremus antarcticus]|uniref:F-box domain-containing protein n=1 Tax=Extremus antarcticus TaxID=702011 RepID=A0AAJ0LXP7_9PEZI|nr:hypothetical protein LTR09_000801 [Extremus antarcticus]